MHAGELIDSKYQVVRLLGAGGMGAVYEARHLGTGRRVAMKVIPKDLVGRHGDALARFQREARAAGAIESMHIVEVLDTGVDPASGHPYLAMEFLSGDDLQRTMKRMGPLSPNLALRVAAQVCLGLQKAHAAGVVHRDIKPANIFLAEQDAGSVLIKILDFGIAKLTLDQMSTAHTASLTASGSMIGSPHYMSPEQAIGSKLVDGRTDIWSLGVVLYEALGGRTPFAEHDTLGSLILAIYSEDPVPLQQYAPWLSNGVAAVVHRALIRDPAGRFQSAAAMLDALHALLPQGYAIHGSMLTPPSPERSASTVPTLVVTKAPARASAIPAHTHALLVPAASTAPRITTSLPKRSSARSRVGKLAIGTAAGMALLGAGGFGLYRATARDTAPSSPLASGNPAPSTSLTETVSAALPLDASSSTGQQDAAIAPRVFGDLIVDGGPLAPATPAVARSVVRPASRRSVGPKPTDAGSPTLASPNCDPNFYFDDQGEKIFKPECFENH